MDTPTFPLGNDTPIVSVHEIYCRLDSLSPRHRDSSFLLLPLIGTGLSYADENQFLDFQLKLTFAELVQGKHWITRVC